MPAAYTHKLSVQVSDFEDIRLLIQLARLICDFCSSSQRFACGFLQIPPHDGHPCRPANDSPCRVHRRLSLPSECALPGAQNKNACRVSDARLFCVRQKPDLFASVATLGRYFGQPHRYCSSASLAEDLHIYRVSDFVLVEDLEQIVISV